MSATYRIAVERSMLPLMMSRNLPACLMVVPGTEEPYHRIAGCLLITVRDSDAPAELEGCIVELTLNRKREVGKGTVTTVMARDILERP